MLRTILNQKNISLYQLEKKSNVSHATLNDIYNERINVDNCSILTMSKIAKALDISIEQLYQTLSYNDLSYFAYDDDFDLFKSSTLQQLKAMNQNDFINHVVSKKYIEYYYEEKDYTKAFYLLSLIDYLCKENSLPLLEQYDELRGLKLKKTYVSKSLYLLLSTKNIRITEVYKECIDSFKDHNILEGQIDNVV